MVRIYDNKTFPDLFAKKQIRVFNVNNAKVCIAQHKGQYFAFDYLCPHQKEPLRNANITPFGEVVCPLHEYRFSLKHGNESSNKCGALRRYELFLEADGVYLNL